MKNKILCLLSVSAAMLTGCVSTAPPSTSVQTLPQITPATLTAPAVTNFVATIVTNPPVYVVSPALTSAVSNIQATVNQITPIVGAVYPPAAPAVPLAEVLIGGILSAITAASSLLAYAKNKSSNSHAASAASLASAVYSNPTLVNQAMAASVSNGSTAATAQHLANAASPV